jgi:uncharacterized membrane protein
MPEAMSQAAPQMQQQTYGTVGLTTEQKMHAVLCYFGILILIPFFMKKEDPFVNFHMRQGLGLLILWFATFIIGFVPILGWMIAWAVNLALLILSIICIIKALSGEQWMVPVIGKTTAEWNI